MLTAHEEVRRGERAVTDEAWIRDVLERTPVGSLSLLQEGRPFLHLNLFVYDHEQRAIFFHTAAQGATRRCVEQDERASFGVSQMGRLLPAAKASGFSVEYASVIATGTVRIVHDAAAQRAMLSLFMAKYSPHLQCGLDFTDVAEEALGRVTVFRIDIQSWSGKRRTAAEDFPGAYSWPEC